MFKFDMKKLTKIVFCTFIIMFFILIKQVSANSIKNIDMDVYIDDEGNATITEVWDAALTEGTEGYRPYSKLGNCIISNFSVTDKTGKTYESLSHWNVNASFEEKAYKCGLNTISNGVELCWGISSYGNNTYTLKYNIDNFVNQYTDKQGIDFKFLNLDQNVSNVKISIRSKYSFSLDNARIWAFGNNGKINFDDGKIVFESNGKLLSSQHVTILVRFENNIFNTINISNNSFDDVYDAAMSTNYDKSIKNFKSYFKGFFNISFLLNYIGQFLWVAVIILIINKVFMTKNHNSIEYRPLDLGKDIKKQEVTYFRDIPCEGDLYYAYWIMTKYKILEENECKNGIIGATLLKWIKEGYIELTKTKRGIFNFRDNNYAIAFLNVDNPELQPQNDLEKYLMRILRQASGDNNILEAKEFEKWCKENHRMMNNWFDAIINNTTTSLKQKKLFIEDSTITKQRGKTKTIVTRRVDSSVRDEALHLMGLKKFLLDYTLIQERQNVEVHILEDYLVFAQLLGIADKVEEQFSKLYPDFKEISKINVENASLYTKTLSVAMVSIVAEETLKYEKIEARRRVRENSHSYSGRDRDSGGGGSSYSSGGDSSGGSSGGGFR